MIELVDLAPTFLDAANLEMPEQMQGEYFATASRAAETGGCRQQVFSEYYNAWTHSDAYGTMLRTEEEKIVVYHGTQQGEFYDLRKDPEEFFNLWDDPDSQERKMRCCYDVLTPLYSRWIRILQGLARFRFFFFE